MSRVVSDNPMLDRDLAKKFSRGKVLQKPFSGEGRRDTLDPEYEGLKSHVKFEAETSDRNSDYRGKMDSYSTDILGKNTGNQFFSKSGCSDRGDCHSEDFEVKGRGCHLQKDANHGNRRDISMNGCREKISSAGHNRDQKSQKFKRLSNGREWYCNFMNGQEQGEGKNRSSLHQLREDQGHYKWKCFDKGSGHHSLINDYDKGRMTSENANEHHNNKSPIERPLTKLKLKVSGITRTRLPDAVRCPEVGRKLGAGQLEGSCTQRIKVVEKARLDGSAISNSEISVPVCVVTERKKHRHKLILPDDSDDNEGDDGIPPKSEVQVVDLGASNVESSSRVNGIHEEDFSILHGSVASKPLETSCNSILPSQTVRKSSRIPKKRILDGEEMDTNTEPKIRQRRKSEQELDDQPNSQEVEGETETTAYGSNHSMSWERTGKRKMRKRIKSDDYAAEMKKETFLTSRQMTMQYNKEHGEPCSSMIEFPEGLSYSSSKKKKQVLTDAEQRLKKEEAAQKRRQQVEKNAKEIQAVTIQKVLGQESQRKKREEKLQKLREELEQEKIAAAMAIPSNSIRWVMGPSGNVVSFSRDVELPNLFSGPCSYPKEREKCAAPLCNNAYKYRDSKSLLPLCSLHCYKAVQKLQ